MDDADIKKRIKRRYKQEALLKYCELKNFAYEDEVTTRKPTRDDLISYIRNNNPNNTKELAEILDLIRYLKSEYIKAKAEELRLYDESDSRLMSALKIYCKDPEELRKLSKYRSIDPSRSMFSSNEQKQLNIQNFLDNKDKIGKVIREELSQGTNSIVTLDDVVRLKDKIRFEIHYDERRGIRERKSSPEFPDRAGPIRVTYPERRMYVEFDENEKRLKVSATNRAQNVLSIFSKVMLGKADAITIQKPDIIDFYERVQDSKIKKMLKDNNVKVTEIQLAKVPLRGSPNLFIMKGNNLLETFDQFSEHRLPIIGKGLSETKCITVHVGKNKVEIDYNRGNQKRTGRISEDEAKKIDEILPKMGIL